MRISAKKKEKGCEAKKKKSENFRRDNYEDSRVMTTLYLVAIEPAPWQPGDAAAESEPNFTRDFYTEEGRRI